MPLSESDFAEFSALVAERDRSTERDCQRWLHHAQEMLFGTTVISFEPILYEQRSFYGDSDFCVCAEVRSDGGGSERQLALWELKSPQTIIMEADDNAHRWRPTRSLVKAETQLLHYHHVARKDQDLHERFNVRPDNILPGGIVIGRDNTWCADVNRLQDAKRSHAIRALYLYRPYGFKLFTWSRVLEQVQPSTLQRAA